MKKQVLAIVLSIVMASGSIGSVPAFAAEADNQEASIEIEQIAEETASGAETVEETAQTAEEEAETTEVSSDSVDTVQDEQTQIPSEASTEAVTTEVAAEEEPDVEDAAQETTADDPAVVPEETVVSKDALNGNEVLLEEEPQYCGDNVTWTLTCRGDEQVGPFTLTISGSGEMYDYYANSSSYLIQSVGRPGTEIMSAPPWYYHCYDIDTVIVEEGVTYIGKHAFSDMTSLTSVMLPSSLTGVGQNAFKGSGITSLSLPSGITELGEGVFCECSELVEMSIPAAVTVIPERLFEHCTALSSISLPENISRIGELAFYECESLSSISLPDSVTEIGVDAFNGCSELSGITLPSGLTVLDECVFARCESLTSIIIPNDVTQIAYGAFAACSNLATVEFPEGLESIGASAFQECTSLTFVEFPFTLGSIGVSAFEDCTSLTDIIVLGKNTETSGNTFYNDEQLFRCYTFHGAYIADHVPTYNGTDSVTTIIYLDGEEEKGEFAFVTDKVIAQVGEEVNIWDYVNGWYPQSEEDDYYVVEISNEEDFSFTPGYDLLTCNGVGETDVTMTYGGKTAVMKVICVDGDIPYAEGVAFKEHEITVTKGQSFFNPFVLVPENSRTDSFNTIAFISDELCPNGWSIEISDPDVVEDDGVSYYAAGTGTTTVSLVDYGTGNTITEFEVIVEDPSCTLFIKDTDIEVEKGTTETLIIKKYPATNTDPVYFESSDNSIVEVSDTGEITAKEFGFTTVTVRCGNVSRKVKVTVPCPATGISLPASVEIRYNEGIELVAELTPSYATDRNVEWEIDNEDLLFMNSWKNRCMIGGTGIGTATVTATINGYTATTEVTVVKGTPEVDKVDPIEAKCGQTLAELELPYNMEWQDPDQSVGSAGEHSFAATYVPDDTEHYEIVDDIMVVVNVSHDFAEEWSSSDGTHWNKCNCGEIVDDNGNGWVSVSSISLNKDEMTLYTGMDDMMVATVLPEDASEKRVIWTTSDENVVTVDEYGTVFAVGAGDAVITAATANSPRDGMIANPTADGGLIAQCTVHVLREPEIVQNPSDVEALVGETVEFTVVAEGNGLTYQWQWSSDGSTWKNCTGTGYNSDTFSFVMKEKFAGRWYRCRVSTSDRRLVSEPALLSLKESDEIIAHPDDVDAEEGDTVAFIVEFSGDHPTYQWQWSSDGTVWRNCTGPSYNTDTFTFVMHAKYAGRMYRCKVTEDGETYISEAALLNLIQVSEILSQPDDAEAAAGETVAFIVEFSGQNPKYQWQKSTDGGATWKNCTGAGYNSSIFSFAMEERFAGRMYRCVITDGDETYISDSALLSLSTDVRITKQPEDVTVKAGQTAVFHVEASGNDLTYQWQCSSNGSTWKNCTSSGYKTDTFSFRAQKSYSGRLYRCRVTSGSDKIYSDPGLLTVTN